MRSHPYLLDIIEGIERDDRKSFYKNVGGLVGSSILNSVIAITPVFSSDPEVHLNRLSKSFFLASNIMLTLGKKFKTSEMLSARYADIFSNIYLGYSLLWYKQQYDTSPDLDFIIDKSIQELLYDSQEKFIEIGNNFPGIYTRGYLKMVTFPYCRRYSQLSDTVKTEIVEKALNSSEFRDFLAENIYISKESHYNKLVETLGMSHDEIDSDYSLVKELCQVNEY